MHFFLLRKLEKINANSLFLFDFTSIKGCLMRIPTFQFLAGGQGCAVAFGSQALGVAEFPGGLVKAQTLDPAPEFLNQ